MPWTLHPKEKEASLKSLALFSTCSRRELSRIASVVVEDEKPAGAVLTRQGETGGVAYLIVTGEAEVTRDGAVLATLGPGDVVGELSLLDGQPRAATVRAVSAVQLLVIDSEDFTRLLADVPELAPRLLGVLAGRIRVLDGQMAARQ
jgi:CRP/FNR family cyclic AMP-dependent transcriptional regulator